MADNYSVGEEEGDQYNDEIRDDLDDIQQVNNEQREPPPGLIDDDQQRRNHVVNQEQINNRRGRNQRRGIRQDPLVDENEEAMEDDLQNIDQRSLGNNSHVSNENINQRRRIRVNDEMARLENQLKRMQVERDRWRDRAQANRNQGERLRERRPEARRSTQDQINAVNKAMRQADISFNGNLKKTNPIWFLNQIEEAVNQELVGDEAFKKVLKAGLKGEAAHWAKLTLETMIN